MRSSLKNFKARALARPDVRREYEKLEEEFEILDEILRARAEAGVTQAELAARIGTTQSAVARLETARGKHSPSIETLKRYASALGYRLQVRLVKERSLTDLEQKTYSVPVDAKALLERAQAIRCIPRGIRVTDRRLNSLKGRLKGMPKAKVREKQKSG
jgi:transcriptional regulator with XRE-family HTH domain